MLKIKNNENPNKKKQIILLPLNYQIGQLTVILKIAIQMNFAEQKLLPMLYISKT